MQSFLEKAQALLGSDGLRTDAESCSAYGRDWTQEFPPKPLAVAFPKSTESVSSLLKICLEQKVAVVPSGGRTGLAAGAVASNGELVLSLEKMNQCYSVDTLGQTVRVQAGAITSSVREHCEQFGLTWPVRFGADGSSHIGGNLSTNAGGLNVLRYGPVRDNVLGVQVVLMGGEVLDLNGALIKNNTGLALKHLVIGSEGTLGIITEATLKLIPVETPGTLLYLSIADVAQAAKLFETLKRRPDLELRAFEYIEASCIDLVERIGGVKAPFKGASLLIELGVGADDDRFASWWSESESVGLVAGGMVAQSSKEETELWKIRELVPEVIAQAGLFHKNDVSVPIAQLRDFTEELHDTFKKMYPDLVVYVFGHLGDGNLHINVVKPGDEDEAAFWEQCRRADQSLFQLVQSYRGSISAEHGIGLLKRDFMHFSRSALELELMRKIKNAFDPMGLMNPGKVYPSS